MKPEVRVKADTTMALKFERTGNTLTLKIFIATEDEAKDLFAVLAAHLAQGQFILSVQDSKVTHAGPGFN